VGLGGMGISYGEILEKVGTWNNSKIKSGFSKNSQPFLKTRIYYSKTGTSF